MLEFCIEDSVPFGVVSIEAGEEVGGGAIPRSVGTTANIQQVLPISNDRFLVSACGAKRFQIESDIEEIPYPTARVAFSLPDDDTTVRCTSDPELLTPEIWKQYLTVGTLRDRVIGSWQPSPNNPLTEHRFCDSVGAYTEGYASDLLRQDLLSTYEAKDRIPVANSLLNQAIHKLSRQLKLLDATRVGGIHQN